eukprot:g12174.t1
MAALRPDSKRDSGPGAFDFPNSRLESATLGAAFEYQDTLETLRVLNFKRKVVEREKLGDGEDYDLKVTDALNGSDHVADGFLLHKNSNLIVRRIPAASRSLIVRLNATKDEEANTQTDGAKSQEKVHDEFGGDIYGAAPTTVEDEEEAAMREAMTNSANATRSTSGRTYVADVKRTGGTGGGRTEFVNYNQRNQQSNQIPHPGYICHRCNQKGHLIRNCPMNNNSDWRRPPLKAAGIPRSSLRSTGKAPEAQQQEDTSQPKDLTSLEDSKPNEEHVGGSFLDPNSGHMAQHMPNEGAFDQVMGLRPNPPTHRTRGRGRVNTNTAVDTDKRLRRLLECFLCGSFLQDAQQAPCCDTCFCRECIRQELMGQEDPHCPVCASSCSIDSLKPNRAKQERVEQYLRDHPEYTPSPRPGNSSFFHNRQQQHRNHSNSNNLNNNMHSNNNVNNNDNRISGGPTSTPQAQYKQQKTQTSRQVAVTGGGPRRFSGGGNEVPTGQRERPGTAESGMIRDNYLPPEETGQRRVGIAEEAASWRGQRRDGRDEWEDRDRYQRGGEWRGGGGGAGREYYDDPRDSRDPAGYDAHPGGDRAAGYYYVAAPGGSGRGPLVVRDGGGGAGYREEYAVLGAGGGPVGDRSGAAYRDEYGGAASSLRRERDGYERDPGGREREREVAGGLHNGYERELGGLRGQRPPSGERAYFEPRGGRAAEQDFRSAESFPAGGLGGGGRGEAADFRAGDSFPGGGLGAGGGRGGGGAFYGDSLRGRPPPNGQGPLPGPAGGGGPGLGVGLGMGGARPPVNLRAGSGGGGAGLLPLHAAPPPPQPPQPPSHSPHYAFDPLQRRPFDPSGQMGPPRPGGPGMPVPGGVGMPPHFLRREHSRDQQLSPGVGGPAGPPAPVAERPFLLDRNGNLDRRVVANIIKPTQQQSPRPPVSNEQPPLNTQDRIFTPLNPQDRIRRKSSLPSEKDVTKQPLPPSKRLRTSSDGAGAKEDRPIPTTADSGRADPRLKARRAHAS